MLRILLNNIYKRLASGEKKIAFYANLCAKGLEGLHVFYVVSQENELQGSKKYSKNKDVCR